MNTKIIIFLIILLSVVLRIYGIEDKNLWFDEVYSWKISQNNVTGIISATAGDIHPPLYYIVLKLWTNIFSDNIASMRLLSCLFGILSLILIYKLSKKFLGSDLQIIFVLLLYTVSPLNIYYSQEVRMLNLNLLLCLGSVFYFFNFLEKQNIKSGIIYTLYSILAIYTHYFAFLILFTQLFIVLIKFFLDVKDKKPLFNFLKYFFVIFLFYSPWIGVFIDQTSKGQPWRTEQTFREVGKSLMDYFKDTFLSTYYTFESNALIFFASIFSIFIILFLALSVIRIMNERSFLTKKENHIFLFFIVPLFIALIISFRQSLVLSRYLSILLPYLFIAMVYFVYKFYKPRTSFILCTLLILISSYGTYINFSNNFKSNDYRKIISYLENNFRDGDQIIAEPHFMGWSIDYFVKHNDTKIVKPTVLGWDLKMQIDSLEHLNDYNNVWVISDYSALDKSKYDSLKILMQEKNYKQLQKKSFYLIPSKVNVEYYTKP